MARVRLTLTIRIVRYWLRCSSCGTHATVPAASEQHDGPTPMALFASAHQVPWLVAIDSTVNDGPLEHWPCAHPRLLT